MEAIESLCFMGKMCQFKISTEEFADIVQTFVQPCIISGLRQFAWGMLLKNYAVCSHIGVN